MSQYLAGSAAPIPIEHYDQLIAYFETACRPRGEWRVGTEYEKVAVLRDSGLAAPFTGGIEEILRRMADRYRWQPIVEDGRIVALQDHGSITLEPGGQFELSGEPFENVHQARREFEEHVEQIVTVAEPLGIVFLGLGIQPISRLERIEWVPKKRYRIMGPYMEQVGTLGQRMMKQTATVQVNIDFGSEPDAMRKLRTGMGIASLLTAMFANSPITDGELNGYASLRGHIWTDTDNHRSGLLPFVFGELCDFSDYANYALDVPMYFIVRDGQWFNMTAMTFRQFWQHGHQGHRATMDDWNAHLTTLFPEFRIKRYIEARSIDSQPPELMLAAPAIIKGIFYADDCLAAAWDLVKAWTWDERMQAYHDSHREALKPRVRGISMRDYAVELLAIARTGLERAAVLDDDGRDESKYLEPLAQLTEQGLCPADLQIAKWHGSWATDPQAMVRDTQYRRR
ncbi:MAG TPA: glutamate--cysteine ligase [Terriglobales bacterium]|nr:glutamate--cysteine ligase [Terriglobales bacterium]